jgi:hypothetical protein
LSSPSSGIRVGGKPSALFYLKSLRGGAVWQLIGPITRRSQVRILSPLLNTKQTRRKYMAVITIKIKDEGNEVVVESSGDNQEVKTKAQRLAEILMKLAKFYVEEK